MTAICPCRLCQRPLDPAQTLRFLFETETQSSPAYLELIRELPHVNGTPLRVCRRCQHELESRPRLAKRAAPADRTEYRVAVLAAVGLVTVGWLFRSLAGRA